MTSIDPTPHHVMSCHVMSKNPFSIKHEGGSRWRGALQVPTVLSYQPHHTYKDYYEKVTDQHKKKPSGFRALNIFTPRALKKKIA